MKIEASKASWHNTSRKNVCFKSRYLIHYCTCGVHTYQNLQTSGKVYFLKLIANRPEQTTVMSIPCLHLCSRTKHTRSAPSLSHTVSSWLHSPTTPLRAFMSSVWLPVSAHAWTSSSVLVLVARGGCWDHGNIRCPHPHPTLPLQIQGGGKGMLPLTTQCCCGHTAVSLWLHYASWLGITWFLLGSLQCWLPCMVEHKMPWHFK